MSSQDVLVSISLKKPFWVRTTAATEQAQYFHHGVTLLSSSSFYNKTNLWIAVCFYFSILFFKLKLMQQS